MLQSVSQSVSQFLWFGFLLLLLLFVVIVVAAVGGVLYVLYVASWSCNE